LWKHVRFRGLPQAIAEGLVDQLTDLPFIILRSHDILKRSLQIGLTHQLAAYDSVYLALAEKQKLPLITVDARQATAARTMGIVVKPITDFQPINST